MLGDKYTTPIYIHAAKSHNEMEMGNNTVYFYLVIISIQHIIKHYTRTLRFNHSGHITQTRDGQ